MLRSKLHSSLVRWLPFRRFRGVPSSRINVRPWCRHLATFPPDGDSPADGDPMPKDTKMVIFDKDGTLICFHSMWVPWTLSTAQKMADKAVQLQMSANYAGIEAQGKQRIEMASGLKSVDIAHEVYRLLGFCPESKRVGPGLLAEGTMPQIKGELTDLLVRHGLSADKASEVVNSAWTDCDTSSNETLKSLHNLKHLFETLKENDVKVAVCTADSRKGTEGALQRLGLDHLVDVVVCGDDDGAQPKPSPHNALEICKALGVEPEEAFMVGDTLADLKMGRAANLKGSIGVLSGVGDKDHLGPHADHLVPHVGDLLPIVLRHSTPRKRRYGEESPTELPRHLKKSYQRGWHIKGAPHWRRDGDAGRRRLHTSAVDRMPLGMPPEGVKPSHVIVGAGSAGCVLANRLSEDSDNTVLMLEAGPRDDWWRWKIHMPAALMYNLCDDSYNWFYHTLPQEHMDGRTMYWPRGRVWGGSSALNAMVYIRGHPADYDRWEREGAVNWSFKHCLPYFKKSQCHNLAKPGDAFRGWDGPLHVTQGDCTNPLHKAFMEAGVQSGFGYTEDMNGYRQEGCGPMDMTTHKGWRWSTSQAYLPKEVLNRRNLFVESGVLTSRVLIDKGQAIGVEYLQFKKEDFHPETYQHRTRLMSGERKKLYCTKDVILSGGAINSPQILMLSGVGDGDLLKKMEIPVEQHLPGVGQNLQDHLEVYVQQACTQPITLYDKSSWKFPHTMIRIGLQWFFNQTGEGASSHLESGGFVRSTPDVEHPDVQFHFLPSTVHDHGRKGGDEHAYQVHVGPMRPTSKGTVRIGSNDPRFHPRIQPNYLSTEQDRKEFRDCIRVGREVFTQKAFDSYRGVELAPGADAQSDEQLDAFVRAKADSAYHPSCTCKMGDPKKSDTVVDAETMNVLGVQGLKVVDASVMPSIVSGNLNAPVIMLAERAADIIRGRATLPPDNTPIWKPPKNGTNKAG